MTKSNDKLPTHTIWQVIGEGETVRWNRIGAAWANRDGKGLSLRFDSFPLQGRTVVREVPEREGDEPDNAETPEAAEAPAESEQKAAEA